MRNYNDRNVPPTQVGGGKPFRQHTNYEDSNDFMEGVVEAYFEDLDDSRFEAAAKGFLWNHEDDRHCLLDCPGIIERIRQRRKEGK